MKPQLRVIRNPSDIRDLQDYLFEMDFIAFDTETTGIHKGAEIIGISFCAAEEAAYYIVLKEWIPATQELRLAVPDNTKEVVDLLNSLKGKGLVGHNALFDCAMIEDNFKVSLVDSLHTDTMILAHLLDENRRVGLKDLAVTMYGESSAQESKEMKASVVKNGGKLTKACYELYKADTDLMGKYGAQDALLTYRLFLDLVPKLYEQKLDKFFYEDESMPMLRGVTYQLNTTGLQVDQTTLLKLKKELEAECLEAKSFIYSEIESRIKDEYPGTNKNNGFKISSPSQLSWLLFGKYELEFGTLTKTGKEVCKALGMRLPYTASAKRDFIAACNNNIGMIYEGKVLGRKGATKDKKIRAAWNYIASDRRTLTKYADRLKWVKVYLEYQKKQKILNTYVKGIEQRTQYGIIRPSFLQHGTTSGRYASRDPNFQNLPRDDRRVKGCIVSRPGRVFIGADYSQLEPRVFASFSGDKRLLAAFDGKSDFYSTIGMEVYDKTDCTPQKDGSPDAFGVKYKKLRDLSKVIALASTYGATAHQLAPTTGKSVEATQADIDSYFEKFPGVAQMMLDSHAMAKKDGQVTNLFGRPRRMPEAMKINRYYGNAAHSELPYDARKLLNLAVNHRIQSTGASIVNRAAIMFLNQCAQAELNARIVLQVHDSLVVECPEAEAESVSLILQHSMETAVELPGVKLEAIPKVGKTLADV